MFAKALQDKFIRHNLIMFGGSMAAAFLNYLFHPVLSRMTTPQDFGEIQTLLALFGNMTLFLGIFGTVIVHNISNTDLDDPRSLRERMLIVTVLRKYALAVAAVIAFAVIAASPLLRQFFRFGSAWPFVGLSGLVVLSVFIAFRRCLLRGALDFTSSSMAEIIGSAAKLAFTAGFVYLGFRTFGAVIGILAAQTAAFVYIFHRSRRQFQFVAGARAGLTPEIRSELRFGLLAFALSLMFTALSTGDVLLIKHYFTPSEAGLYSGISTVAKVVLYLTGSIVGVLGPSVRRRYPPAENQKLLFKSLVMVAGLGGCSLALFVTFPEFVIRILIGERFLAYVSLLPRLSLLMFLIAFINTIFSYYLQLRQAFIVLIGLAGVVLIAILSWADHSSPEAVVGHFLSGAVAVLLLVGARWARVALKHRLYVRK